MKTKICTGKNSCGQEKPETEEFFSFRKDLNSFKKNCKDCINEYAKDYRDKNKKIIAKTKKKYSDKPENKKNKVKREKERHNNFPWKRILYNIKFLSSLQVYYRVFTGF